MRGDVVEFFFFSPSRSDLGFCESILERERLGWRRWHSTYFARVGSGRGAGAVG